MSISIGINGFGRMGRLGVRAAWGWKELDFVQVNEIACDAAGSAHLLKFDSVHGTRDRECEGEGGELRIDGRMLGFGSNQGIGETYWSGCDLVVDVTQVKVLAWYDNEWGYVNRMMELARKIAGGL